MTVESNRRRGQWTFKLFGRRCGFERSDIIHGNSLYMSRWILYVLGYTLRLHCIHRPDRDRALHNHPFWFVTLPLGTYREMYWESFGLSGHMWVRDVRPWRPHFRGIDFRHRICHLDRPVWTIVLSGPYVQPWGFYPKPDEFVPYKLRKGDYA